MNDATPIIKTYDAKDCPKLAAINTNEVMRYAGAKDLANDDSFLQIMDECIEQVTPVLSYKISYRGYDLLWEDTEGRKSPELPFESYGSKDIAINLTGCERVIIFAATIGIGIDRLIAKYSRISPSKALFMQAFGAERIEALCDYFCSEMKLTNPRFSPGYGDLPLDAQKEIFTLLDCERRIGLTLNESLLMSPSKSVTAIVGIKNSSMCDDNVQGISKCAKCTKTDCEYRVLG